jgi:hypothetical protein
MSTALPENSYFIRQEIIIKKKTLLGFEKTIILDFNIQVISNYSRIIYKATTRTRTRGQKGKTKEKNKSTLLYTFQQSKSSSVLSWRSNFKLILISG